MIAAVNWYVRCRREINSFVRDASAMSSRSAAAAFEKPSEQHRQPRIAKTKGLSILERELQALLLDASGKTTPLPKHDSTEATPRTIPKDTETPRCPPSHFCTPTTRAKDLLAKNVTDLTNDEVAIVLLAKFSR